MFKILGKFIKNSSLSLLSLIFTGTFVFAGFYFYMLITLPEVNQLKDISLQIPLRIYSSDNKLIAEFGEKKRIPVSLNAVPKNLIHAILDTEDQRFFEHRGVDFLGLVRATLAFLESGKKAQGASTITMQVARNFFLNRQKTFARKLNEILLAFKIDNALSKKEILELYLNKIYFGNRAYGVAAAAQVYYGKQLDELSLDEIAMIAGLPQAPSRDNPITNPNTARERRNHVLQRMLESNHISTKEYNIAISMPVETNYHESKIEVPAPYAAEMVRNSIIEKYGDAGYNLGIKVYTTIDSELQKMANQALHDGLLAYDQRHGYRGPEGKLTGSDYKYWQQKLKSIPTISDLQPAVVISSHSNLVTTLLANGDKVNISHEDFSWAKTRLNIGDIVRVYQTTKGLWRLAQIPKIEGAIVTLDPKNGAILALSGGFSYAASNFNRAIQAERQTGSVFKPFVYSAALENGFTLSSVINDSPIVLLDPSTKTLWRPQNDTQTFYGPTRLRTALIASRNLVSIRVLQMTGIPFAIDYLKRFGFEGLYEVPPALSLALGSGATTPLKLTVGYAAFANGGYKVTPYLISSITETTNKGDRTIFQADPATIPEAQTIQDNSPQAPRAINAQNAYLITDALKNAITSGTARKAKVLNREDLAGKTGTTNEQMDAWFAGYNSDLVTTVWVGFDLPKSIHEHGAKAALPIWIQFMQQALEDRPINSMLMPPDITAVKIDPTTGLLAYPGQKDAIFEIFANETIPKDTAPTHPTVGDDQLEEEEESSDSLF